MQPLLCAVDLKQVLYDAFMSFLPIAGIAIAFGVVYWMIRRRKEKRETAKRVAWIAERRAKRQSTGGQQGGAQEQEPADR